MGATPVSRRGAGSERLRASAEHRAITPAEAAWIAAVPCTLLTIAAMLALGPPLAHAFLTPRLGIFWPSIPIAPQPEQHGRYLVALLGPPLLAAVVLAQASPRVAGRARLSPGTIRALVHAAQAAFLALVVACVAAQNDLLLSADFPQQPSVAYFNWRTLLVALLLPALALGLLRQQQLAARLPALLRETPRRRRWCGAAAALFTIVWLTTAVNLDSSIGNTHGAVYSHLAWTIDEAFAVLNGRTPTVDYHAQYGQLWAYLVSLPMALLGATIATYTLTLATASGLAILGLYAILRRLTRSSVAALALYLPLVATAFFTIIGPLGDRYAPQNLYLLWPIRYGGPMLLAFLVARHVDGARPRRPWALFALTALVALNNVDWGLAAGLATFAALAAVPPLSWRRIARLAGEALAATAAAIALFSLLTLVRSGSLPRFHLLFEFSRLYGVDGWAQLPMPALGLHVALFLTFVAALATAAVRVVRGARRQLLTSMLAWVGTFGLGASVYYGGRAHALALFDYFAPWALAIELLLLAVLPGLVARGWRRPALPELAVLFSLGLIVCSLPQTPTPWSQVARLRDDTPAPFFKQLPAVQLVRETTRPGERVAVLTGLSHRVAYDAGVSNVSPYSSVESMPTPRQLAGMVATIRRAGARKLYAPLDATRPEQLAALQAAGFAIARTDPSGRFALLLDRKGAVS